MTNDGGGRDGLLLDMRRASFGYGTVSVVRNLTMSVMAGEVVALLGANGAGKTTTILALSGELPPLAGHVAWKGAECRLPLCERARQGLSLITEERSVFFGLTVAENLRLGGGGVDRALELFPTLREHAGRKAGLLSGGQQQMLTLARALASEPSVLLADELSLGLAPLIVSQLLASLREAADHSGLAVVLVEQHIRNALAVADRAYVLQHGRCVLNGTARELSARIGEIERLYLAGPAGPDMD
jgi:branched-chain amino acid transport system ATP-binding protein